MKLLRHGPKGQEKPAMLDQQGQVRDLSGLIGDLAPRHLTPEGLTALRAIDVGKLPVVTQGRLGVPWVGMSKFIAIGLNYADHAAESGMPIPKEPVVFTKAISCAVGANHSVVLPRGSVKTDWEVELAVVIGRRASYIDNPADALDYVAGYAVSNDVSEREFQMERGGQWDKGKSCDTFNPLGPWIVTADELRDPQTMNMWLDVDGQREQSGHTSDMIFNVDHIVWYVSQFMTLEPGDIINTGTPSGVGIGKQPPRYLDVGQEMRVGIDGLGEQCVHTVATP